MINYKPFWDLLKRRGISRRWIMKYGKVGQSTLEKMRDNKPVDLRYIERLCNFLHCSMIDIVEVDNDD